MEGEKTSMTGSEDDFAERRMGMHGMCYLGNVAVVLHDDRHFVDEVAGMCTEDVCTEDASVGSGKDFHESVVGIHRQRLAVGTVE